MQKLIDADKLKTELSGETSLHNLLASVIDSQPLVDAVPREVINEMIDEIEQRKETLDYTLSILVKGDAMEGRLQGAKEAIEEMIEIVHKYCDEEQ